MKSFLFNYKLLSIFTIFVSTLISCSDITDIENITNSDTEETSTLRSAFDNYFDWYKYENIEIVNPYLNRTTYLSLPWAPGSSDNGGIPKEWMDENTFNPNFSQRFYSPDKGWVLVYSNIKQNSAAKYFALYNKYTGILRFFFYSIGSSSGSGTSASLWGIAVDKSTSLMNFTYMFSKASNEKISAPSIITTPEGSIVGGSYKSIGYKENMWYGLELECAYDPSLSKSNHCFYIKGWGVNDISLTGTGTTTGTITGTIKTNVPNSNSFNLSLNNMLNTTSSTTTIIADKESGSEVLGKTIDAGIQKNDKFFKGLWGDIQKNASKWITTGLQAGAQKGLAAILSSGGSVIADAAGGLLNSLIGGGKKESISKVDLALNATTDIKISGTSNTVGWGLISALPIPGSSTNQYNQPIYNKLLGVWNLKEAPFISSNISATEYWVGSRSNPQYLQYATYRHSYQLGGLEIELNPEIENEFERINTKYILLMNGGDHPQYDNVDLDSFTPGAFLNNKKYYYVGNNTLYNSNTYTSYNGSYPTKRPLSVNFIVNVSFQIKHKTTGEIYYFSRYFEVNKYFDKTSSGRVYSNKPDNTRPIM